MKATGYVGDAVPGMTFRLQVPPVPIMVNTSSFTRAHQNLCSCCFQGNNFKEGISDMLTILRCCVDVFRSFDE